MTEDEIPEFVEAVIATGCDICAVGGDGDITREHYHRIADELGRIKVLYGERDHLKAEIIDYLRSIGRNVEIPTVH